MEDYKKGAHTVWDCKYHLVWTTKCRYEVLSDDVGQRCKELLREIARSKEMTIYAGSINRDHVHMLIGIPPNLSVSKAVQYLKGKKLTQAADGIQAATEAVLGSASLGPRVLGSDEW